MKILFICYLLFSLVFQEGFPLEVSLALNKLRRVYEQMQNVSLQIVPDFYDLNKTVKSRFFKNGNAKQFSNILIAYPIIVPFT